MASKYKIKHQRLMRWDILTVEANLAEYPRKAKRIFEKMNKLLQMTQDMPRLWSCFDEAKKYRKIVIEDYILLYEVDDEAREIRPYRLLHSKMDIPRHIDT